MVAPRLAIVIHAEEEFDWSGSFRRSNKDVTHGNELTLLIDKMLNLDAKVTLAMDYPFVISDEGREVIEHFKHLISSNIEFAAHLHPWVNPPFETENDVVDNFYSYPGNLAPEFELKKLKVLAQEIEKVTGCQPTTYLAGRYGIGINSNQVLESLGFKTDLSISSYCDFSHQGGPDFTSYTNEVHVSDDILHFPHTGSIITAIPYVSDYFNRNPAMFTSWQSSKVKQLLSKLLRIRRYRLSPEGFDFRHMKALTRQQIAIGQKEFIFSFHSPSAKPGCTPYVNSDVDLKRFEMNITKYIKWFRCELNGEYILPNEQLKYMENNQSDYL
ncbi:MAG: hypothetical protein JKY55_08875 [Aliivibrio sp.]|uniref:hypothetical protein n=1 Tax=Aliivibrio sp. TaxID=1872443 RepID=UPI001A4EDBF4|nr:hypothetical protein [Aliivibrio sp.]